MLCSDMEAAYIVFALMTFECIMAKWSEVLLFLLGFRACLFRPQRLVLAIKAGVRFWLQKLVLAIKAGVKNHLGCRGWCWPSRLVFCFLFQIFVFVVTYCMLDSQPLITTTIKILL